MKHQTPYRLNETSLSPVRERGIVLVFSYREQINSFYPVLYIKILDMTKVLYIVSDNRQTCSFCSTAYEKVEILNGFSTILQAQLLLGINIDTVGKRQYLYFIYEIIYQLQIFLRTITLVSTVAQFGQHYVTDETPLTTYLVQPLSHIMVVAEKEYTNARVKQILFHNSNSLLLAVLLSRISLIISSAERLSFQAPAKRLAQSDSVLAFFAGTNDFTKASIFVIADSLSRSGLISRNNSARNSIAVIIVIFLFSGARTVQAESNQVHLNCRGVARSRILRLQRYKEKSNKQRIRIK